MHLKKISFISLLFFFPCLPQGGTYSEKLQMEYFTSGFVGSIEEYVRSTLPQTTYEGYENFHILSDEDETSPLSFTLENPVRRTKKRTQYHSLTPEEEKGTRFRIASTHTSDDGTPESQRTSSSAHSTHAEHYPNSRFRVTFSIPKVPEEKPAIVMKEKEGDGKYLPILTDVIMDPERKVDFGILEAFFYSSKNKDEGLFLSLARRFNPLESPGSEDMTELDRYLHYNVIHNVTTLSIELVKFFIIICEVNPHSLYTNEKGVKTCFADEIEKSSLTNKAEILALLKEAAPAKPTSPLAPSFYNPLASHTTVANPSKSLRFGQATRPNPPCTATVLSPKTPVNSSFTPPKQKPSHSHFCVPLMTTLAHRESIIGNCKLHMQYSHEQFTFEEVDALIRCVDDTRKEDLQFLYHVLTHWTDVHEVDGLERNHYWSLIPYGDSPISLKKLKILLMAKINPLRRHAGNESFMEYLNHPFRSLNPKKEREAYEYCQKFLNTHSYDSLYC